MPKKYNIKWNDNDTKRLASAVRRFNAKRTRLLKQVPELEDFLPPKASTKDIRNNVKTRRDLKNELNSLERFLRKGAEKPIVTKEGVKTTAYEKQEISIKVRAINLRRAAELKKAAPSTEKGTMGTIRKNNLQPKTYDIDKIRKSDWGKFVESVEKQSRDSYGVDKSERYKKNYMEGLLNAFGEKARGIYDLVELLDADVLVEAYYNDPVLQIDFFYDPLEMQVKIDAIEEHLNAMLENM